MEQLKELLKQGDNQIKEIKQQQLLLIENFIRNNYGYEIGTIILVNNIKGAIVGFVYNVKLRKFEIDGKYTGK